MNGLDPTLQGDDRLQGDDATRLVLTVDEACRRFAHDLVEGNHPDIEALVEMVPPPNRDTLRERLEALSALLTNSGDPPSPQRDGPAIEPLDNDETVERFADPTAGRSSPAHPVASDSTKRRSQDDSSVSVPGYRIEKVLGRGGMGVVYQAVDETLGRRVALKMVIHPGDGSETLLRRFKLEAQAVAELNDPRFVQIYEYGTHHQMPFMVLELVEGGSLEDFRQKEPQSERFAAEITRSLAYAMHVAHAAGLIHRDLKPQNVLLTKKLEPKIADFGLVKRLDQEASQMTQHGSVMGTASYMAPEQSRGETDIGPPADIHALGGILYCLLTGRPPFLGSNVYDTIQQVRTEEPVPPSRLRPKLSNDLETICLKCLHKSPEKRYASAEELAEDLQRFLDGRPILARPVSLPERAWRWTRRNPLAATVAALVLAIAIGATAASWRLALLNQRLTLQKQTTERARALAVRRQREAESARGEEARQRAAADAA
ncbi:MAG TPA: serine/threonine protein kinase, partial [Planctomycetaceae bacterium]|nr:serine/threonine protein kinase [Planctomycetaceae bacterium]